MNALLRTLSLTAGKANAGAGPQTWTSMLQFLLGPFRDRPVVRSGRAVGIDARLIAANLALCLVVLLPTTHAADTDETRPEDPASSGPPGLTENWAIHGQSTYVEQYHPAFCSPYSGEQSLSGCNCGNETFGLTLYAGLRLWRGAELWANPEVSQGFGLSGTHGVAGFPSAESYKAGSREPYLRWQRLFLRQTINLGGATQRVEPDLNVLGGTQSANRVVLTIGKFAAPDIFDTNKYAHDGHRDFLNWSLLTVGT